VKSQIQAMPPVFPQIAPEVIDHHLSAWAKMPINAGIVGLNGNHEMVIVPEMYQSRGAK